MPREEIPAQQAKLRERRAPDIAVTQTEEGQSVAYDAFTWQRRELAKRLPLDEPWPAEKDIEATLARFDLDKPPVSEVLPAPSRVAPDVYLVASKTNHAYLIDAGPAGLVLVDPGPETNVEVILANVESLGFARTDIKWVINTHAHFDHSMADAQFQRLGAKILVGEADVGAVEKGTLVTAKYVLPPDEQKSYPTLEVDWPVDDGEELRLGDKTILAIATPDHTDGSTCYVLQAGGRTVLFGGDTILFDYRLGAQGTPFADNERYGASLKKLATLGLNPKSSIRWDILLPGHGTIVLNRAYLDVSKGMRQVQLDLSDGIPVNALPFGNLYYRQMMFGRPVAAR
ncbi:MBL fold metallo-hydrolase [Tsuneonella dongtanensis]|uniref:MBL fold metallo-hydrolase n=1 Tax=Tsuneonella dongtanensis TaxID=692370 RepID=UPI00082F2C43|nr:MBL fold metallo-hydrolase [Tsuneonella dongtanensis]